MTTALAVLCLAGGFWSPIWGDESRPKLIEADVLAQFNCQIEAGNLQAAEALAREAFLKSSSDPQAVLMVRQVFLMQKLQDSQLKSRLMPPPQAPKPPRKESSAIPPVSSGMFSGYGSKIPTCEGEACPPLVQSRPITAAHHKVDSKKLREEMETRVFSVADLAVPIPPLVSVSAPPAPLEPEFKGLIELITHTVEPASWSSGADSGSIVPHAPSLGLIVRQTPSVHAEIEELLSKLRKKLDDQVSLEVTRIDGPPQLLDQFCRSLRVTERHEAPADGESCCLAHEFCEMCDAHVVGESSNASGTLVQTVKPASGSFKLSFTFPPRFQSRKAAAWEDRHAVLNTHTVSVLNSLAAPWNLQSCLSRIAVTMQKPEPAFQVVRLSLATRNALLECLRNRDGIEISQLPKLTLFAGQTGELSVQDRRLRLSGEIESGRQRVRVVVQLDPNPGTSNQAPTATSPLVNISLKAGETLVLLDRHPSPSGHGSKLNGVYLVTAKIIPIPEETAETSSSDDLIFDRARSSSALAPLSIRGLKESLQSGAIDEQRLRFGVGVPPHFHGNAPGGNPPSKGLRSGGIEIVR